MFFKLFAVCLIAVQATSVAAFVSPHHQQRRFGLSISIFLAEIDFSQKKQIQIEPGVYRITNVVSGSTVRTYNPDTPLVVSSTLEFPGPFELVKIFPKIIFARPPIFIFM